MPISASQIVDINPRIIQAGANQLEFNGLLLSRNPIIPVNAVLNFADAEGVGQYFGLESEEYNLANTYFLGYQNAFKSPNKLFFARAVNANVAAFLRSAKYTGTLQQLQAITAGSLSLSIDGLEENIENINFSTATSYSEVAQLLEAAMTNAGIVTFSSINNAFTITSPVANEDSSITFASGSVADILNLSENLGATISQGSAAQSEVEQMEAIINITQNFVNFSTVFMPTEEEILGYTAWANSKEVAYLYIFTDNSQALLIPNSEATTAFKIKEAQYSSVAGSYANDTKYAVFLMGIGASIDWLRPQSTITAAFKSQSGLAATVTNGTDAQNLIAQGMNFVGDYATRNDNFVFNYPGQMFGTYKFIDVYWNAIWLNNQLQANLLLGLSSSGRTSYTQAGYTLVRAWMQSAINQALVNGVIEAGVSLSDIQKAQINKEAGLDISAELEQTGYYIQVLDPGASARVNRDSPIISLWYTYGGAINKLVVASTAIV